MKVKVIATPTGEAPEWVRKSWVGVVLDVVGVHNNGPLAGVVTGKKVDKTETNNGGYIVSGKQAIEALEKINPKAAQWWYDNTCCLFTSLVFGKIFCEELPY